MSDNNKVYCGDARTILRQLPEGSFDCVVTSPPYYSLRDYGIPALVWGGDPGCEHSWTSDRIVKNTCGGWNDREGPAKRRSYGMRTVNVVKLQNAEANLGAFCAKCGAWRGCLGLEPHVDLYIDHLLEICAEIHRVLKPQGTFWLNIGDTYCNARPGARDAKRWPKQSRNNHRCDVSTFNRGVKRKELFLVPARMAIALQEAGWYVRQDIIWAKKNPMPESVKDRCTKSHEYVYLLTKAPRYYFDSQAIKEPQVEYERLRRLREKKQGLKTVYKLARDGKTGLHDQSQGGACRSAVCRQKLAEIGLRNKRSVWTTSAARFKGNHFATFPRKLIEPMILAGCPAGGVVLDPFCGSGTTLQLAISLGRSAVGIDLSPQNVEIADALIHQTFKWDFLNKMPEEGGTIKGDDIRRWLKKQLGR